jgi:hypothetical protein
MGTVRIALEAAGLLDTLVEYLNDNIDVITPALAFDKAERHERATVDETSIQQVRINGDGAVELDYEYEWSFFSGCKDISDGGLVQSTIKGRLVGGFLEFNEVERAERRSTFDEF